MLFELVATVGVAAYFALLAFGHALLAVEIYQCVREDFLDGHDRGDPSAGPWRGARRLPAGRSSQPPQSRRTRLRQTPTYV